MPFSRLGVQVALTVAGGVYFAALLFMALWWLGVTSIVPAQPNEKLLPYLAVGALAVSYMFGVVAYEVVILSLRPLSLLAERWFNWSNLRVVRNTAPGAPSDLEVAVWQHGSERLARELDGMVANLWLIRLLLVGLPALAIAAGLWCRDAGHVAEGQVIRAALLFCTAVLIPGHHHQVRRMKAFLESTERILQATRQGSGAA